jgi:hypothetical protein
MRDMKIETKVTRGTITRGGEKVYQDDFDGGFDRELPAGVAATVLAKTDANTATFDLPDDHDLPASGNFNIFWGTVSVRYGVPATVADGVLSADGGAGVDFPANGTAVVISEQVEIILPALTAALITAMSIYASRRAHFHFVETGAASAWASSLSAGQSIPWAQDFNTTSPLAGKVPIKVLASCGEAAGISLLAFDFLYNSVDDEE